MSMTLPFRAARYMTVALHAGRWPPAALLRSPDAPAAAGQQAGLLLRVVLDDELLLDESVDMRTHRQGVHEDPHLVRNDLDPRWRSALACLGLGYDKRGQVPGLGATSTMSFSLTR